MEVFSGRAGVVVAGLSGGNSLPDLFLQRSGLAELNGRGRNRRFREWRVVQLLCHRIASLAGRWSAIVADFGKSVSVIPDTHVFAGRES